MRFYPGSYTDLQETAARIPALSRLLQGNGILTASGLISEATVKRPRVRKRKEKGIGGAVPHTLSRCRTLYVQRRR